MYAFMTTTRRKNVNQSSNLSLNVPFLSKTDGSRLFGISCHDELVDEPFLWQFDGSRGQSAWVGKVADWWTQESTAAMQASQKQPLYTDEDRRNGRGAAARNRRPLQQSDADRNATASHDLDNIRSET
jgi:hypothetical protein